MNLPAGHILAVRLDSAGDVLLTGPAVAALSAVAGRVTLLCGPRGREAAELLPGVERTIILKAPWIDPEPEPVNPAEISGLIRALADDRPDAAFIFTSFHQSPLPTALLLRMAGVAWVAAISDDYPGSLLDLRHKVDEDMHEVQRSLSLVAAAGIPAEETALQVRRPLPQSPVEPGYVVLHPGASVPARAWSPEKHRRLAELLTAAGERVVITGSPDEMPLCDFVGSSSAAAINLGGQTPLAELAAVLEAAEAVVVGNTGPAHLAAAVGTPVISLFAPTVPAVKWRPWGVPHRLFGNQEIPCAGCRARQCPVPGHPCLDSISAEEVADAVLGRAAWSGHFEGLPAAS